MVRCSGARAGTWIAFKGKRAGAIIWPALSVPGSSRSAHGRRRHTTLRLRAPVVHRVLRPFKERPCHATAEILKGVLSGRART